MNGSPSDDRAVWLTLLDRLAKTASAQSRGAASTVIDLTSLDDLRVAERRAYQRYLSSSGV